ncbi:MAG: hypothetical protein CBD88_07880 [Flavobacteriales bacterium TMED228]|nr:MAG: hypothetical protein CBD88_07880 [Flavobacteriales bacterium TMED228]|tara:strand:- start:1104 stop:2474 length:1371 start_codon:yes stop_codon:yes gene_type:complete
MAQRDTDKFLKDMHAFIDANVRKNLDSFYTIVTMTAESLGQGFKEGYEDVKKTDKKGEREFPVIDDAAFTAMGADAVDAVAKHVQKPRTAPKEQQYIPGKLICYAARRDFKNVYTIAKKSGLKSLNKFLKTPLKGVQVNPETGKRSSARASEVGIFKSGLHRAHQGVTTVGAAQLAAGLKFLDRSRNFGGFLTSEAATSLQDIYPAIDAVFETTGTKKGGKAKTLLKEEQAISLLLGPRSDNEAGAQDFDFKNLRPKLELAVREYIDTIPLADRTGSKSIRQNAEDATERFVLDKLMEELEIAQLTTTAKPSARKKQRATNSTRGKPKRIKGSKKRARATPVRTNNVQPSKVNIATVLGTINSKLSDTVAKNMVEPRLVNRTGRLAGSVRVVDVNQTPQGHTSLGYSYQRDPYEVFESTSGTRFSSSDRDPRKLIDVSIRELAMPLALGRLFTRRV